MNSPDPATLLVHLDNGVARVTINRPTRRNALDRTTTQALCSTLARLAIDADCRVMVLSGNGGYFCAGADLKELRELSEQSPRAREDIGAGLEALLTAMHDFPKPIICEVQGGAQGLGMGLVGESDYVVADSEARFAVGELRHGMVPGSIMPTIMRTLGPRTGLAWLLDAEPRTASGAQEAGLVTQVVPLAELESAVGKLATGMAAFKPEVVARTKQLVRAWR